jgi:hypothetical protein
MTQTGSDQSDIETGHVSMFRRVGITESIGTSSIGGDERTGSALDAPAQHNVLYVAAGRRSKAPIFLPDSPD